MGGQGGWQGGCVNIEGCEEAVVRQATVGGKGGGKGRGADWAVAR